MIAKLILAIRRVFWMLIISFIRRVFGISGVSYVVRLTSSCDTVVILRLCGAYVGQDVSLHSPLRIINAKYDYSNLGIGNHVHIGTGVLLDLDNRISIEDRVTISMDVNIITHQKVGQSPLSTMGYPFSSAPVIIEYGAYIGSRSVVLHGTCIGSCSIIGANSLIIKSIPAYSVAVGSPAKVVKQIETYEQNMLRKENNLAFLTGKYREVQEVFDDAINSNIDYTDFLLPSKMVRTFEQAVLLPLKQLTNEHLKILEVGCGNGRWLLYLQQQLDQSVDIHGIDLSASLIQKAREKMQESITLIQGNFLDNMSLSDHVNSFDVVYFFDVFQHLYKTDYYNALVKAINLINTGGLIIIIDKEQYSLYGLRMSAKRILSLLPGYYQTADYPSFQSLIRLAQQNNIVVIKHGKNREYRYLILRSN